jgi:sugar phosphate permease
MDLSFSSYFWNFIVPIAFAVLLYWLSMKVGNLSKYFFPVSAIVLISTLVIGPYFLMQYAAMENKPKLIVNEIVIVVVWLQTWIGLLFGSAGPWYLARSRAKEAKEARAKAEKERQAQGQVS